MSANLLARLSRELSELKARSRYRDLLRPAGIDFTSNDYLGLARHPALAQALREALERVGTVGSAGSRLLRGNHQEHEELEQAAAAFFHAESALYFNSGFDANLALFSALPSRRAGLVLDERVHASIKEGARASFAKKYTARHNDPKSFEDALRRARKSGARELFIVVESVYSMDGDRAPLPELLALAHRHEATLIVDEAHATGVFGRSGRGLSEDLQLVTPAKAGVQNKNERLDSGLRRNDELITVHTCGKALGASGALVVGSRVIKEYLINAARPFLYSTAASPLLAAVVRRALALVDEEPWRRDRLLKLADTARKFLSSALSTWRLGGDRTQILPIIIGDDTVSLRAAEALQTQGLDVRAIRPPTVLAGQCRLRISLNVERSEADLERLAHALRKSEAMLVGNKSAVAA